MKLSLFTVSISQRRLALYLGYCLCMIGSFPYVLDSLPDPGFGRALMFAYLLALLVPSCIIFGRRLDLVEPLYWFSAMFYLVVPVAIYSLLTGFATSEHLLDVGASRLHELAEHALLLFILGYSTYLLGYLALMEDRPARRISLLPNRAVSGWVTRLAIMICVMAGLINFLYILVQYPRGMLEYIVDFGMRAHRYEAIEGAVSTFGYQFLYAGIFLWMILLKRDNISVVRSTEGWAFSATAMLSVIVSLSQGRLTQTVTYLLMLAFLTYILSGGRGRNYLYIILAAGGLFLGILFYFMRRLSVLAYGDPNAVTIGSLVQYAGVFKSALGFWLVDKGNLPNLAVVINLVGQHGLDGELWYGRSFATWMTSLSDQLGNLPNIGQSLGAIWFSRDGGVPPTIVGEMYLNFGHVGVPLGLLLVGIISSWFYGYVRRRGHAIWYIVYLALLFKFIFIWPKGETANIVAAIWQFLPTVLVFFFIRFVSSMRPFSDHRSLALQERVGERRLDQII